MGQITIGATPKVGQYWNGVDILEAAHIAFTPEGRFLAFKKVRDDLDVVISRSRLVRR